MSTASRYELREPVLFFGGVFIQCWGALLIWRGLNGEDVFVYGSILDSVGVAGIVILVIGLFLLCIDLSGLVLNVLSGRDEFDGLALWSEDWLTELFVMEAVAFIFCLAAGAIVLGFAQLFKELGRGIGRKLSQST